MPETFVPMREWFTRDIPDESQPIAELVPEPESQALAIAEPDDAFADLCGELRRFRAALLDALECAREGRVACLRIQCGTIDACIEIDARQLTEALQ